MESKKHKKNSLTLKIIRCFIIVNSLLKKVFKLTLFKVVKNPIYWVLNSQDYSLMQATQPNQRE